MGRIAFAVLVGILLVILFTWIEAIYDPFGLSHEYQVHRTPIPGYVYLFVATLIAGFLARRHGWLCGLLVYSIPVFIAFIAVQFVHKDEPIDYSLWAIPIPLLVCVAGGHLGQLLAQKWHKRARRKHDASQDRVS
jgi:ATP/ADP translocase